MRATNFVDDEGGSVNPSSGVKTTANDYINFLSMLLNKGMFEGKKILSEESIAEMQKPQFTSLPVKYLPKEVEGMRYGLGLWIDMSEYQEKHTVSRLVGAPPGYVGYDEGGQLTEAVRRKPYQVVLLDEIEKAHPDVWNVMLQVLDDGRLTDNKGRVVNFKNTIIIMTSNLGSNIIQENFGDVTESNREKVVDKTKTEVMTLLRQTIRPEFLNRVDEIILFQPLLKKEIRGIIRIQLDNLNTLVSQTGIQLEFSDYLLDFLAENGFDPQYGARPLKRLIQKEIVNQLSKKILSGDIDKSRPVLVDVFDGVVVFRNDSSASPAKPKERESVI